MRWTEPDGNVQTISFTCAAPPYFFRRERVFVLYTGTDPAVLTLLTGRPRPAGVAPSMITRHRPTPGVSLTTSHEQ